MSFHDRVKEYRLAKGYSLEYLAELIGDHTKNMVYKWEQGGGYPSVESLLNLAVVLDVSIDDLFADELAYLRKSSETEIDPFPGITAGMMTFANRLRDLKTALRNEEQEGVANGDDEE